MSRNEIAGPPVPHKRLDKAVLRQHPLEPLAGVFGNDARIVIRSMDLAPADDLDFKLLVLAEFPAHGVPP